MKRMSQWPMIRLVFSLAIVVTLFSSVGVVAAEEPTSEPAVEQADVAEHDHSTHDHGNAANPHTPDGGRPGNCEAVGLQHAPGLNHSDEHSQRCTHGPDAAPAGYDIATRVAPLAAESLTTAEALLCDGDGDRKSTRL